MFSRLVGSIQRRAGGALSASRFAPVRTFSGTVKPAAPKPAPNPNFAGVVGEATENFFDVANGM